MRGFFNKYAPNFDEDDALRYIKRHLDGYARGGGGSGGGGGSSSGGSSGGGSSYHSNGEAILKELAQLIEMCEDFFAEKGLDYRSYIESNRRGR